MTPTFYGYTFADIQATTGVPDDYYQAWQDLCNHVLSVPSYNLDKSILLEYHPQGYDTRYWKRVIGYRGNPQNAFQLAKCYQFLVVLGLHPDTDNQALAGEGIRRSHPTCDKPVHVRPAYLQRARLPVVEGDKPLSKQPGKFIPKPTAKPSLEKKPAQPTLAELQRRNQRILASLGLAIETPKIGFSYANLTQEFEAEPNLALAKNNLETDPLTLKHIANFLEALLDEWELTIGDYFAQMQAGESFFLIAATGLGKTVGTPVYLLCQTILELATQIPPTTLPLALSPRVWVVVPTIAIAQESCEELGKKFAQYIASVGIEIREPARQSLYGARSKKYKANFPAPIQFITTGVLPLLARSGELRPGLDTVLIDEAHKTLSGDEGMELALSQLWDSDILVHFMSATVGTHMLAGRLRTKIIRADEERFPKYWHNSGQGLIETALEAVRVLHVKHDTGSAYFPPRSHPHHREILAGVDPQGQRASGILVVVDSFNGVASDAVKLREALAPLCQAHNIEILGFASSVRDDDARNRDYQDRLRTVLKQCGRYVIIATNVIEMGVTWSTLDLVVTGDTEIVNEMVAGQLVPVKRPISTAALLQRGGRVGRQRPGLVTIASSGVSPVSTLSDEELIASGLEPQPIIFPLKKFAPAKLAWRLTAASVSPKQAYTYLGAHPFPSIVNFTELGYVSTMTKHTMQKYIDLGVNEPRYLELLQYFNYYVGDPIYPWLCLAVKAMVDSLPPVPPPEYPGLLWQYRIALPRALNRFLYVVLFGYWATIDTARVVNSKRDETYGFTDYAGDLLLVTSINGKYLPGSFEGRMLENHLEIWTEETNSEIGNWYLKSAVFHKSRLQFVHFFRGLMNELEKKNFPEENIWHYFRDGWTSFDDGDEDMDGQFEFREYMKPFKTPYEEGMVKGLIRQYYKTHGTNFTVKSATDTEIILKYSYQDKKVVEKFHPKSHLIRVVEGGKYYGIVLPKTTRDQQDVQVTMSAWMDLERLK